jgi:hypothetical protein
MWWERGVSGTEVFEPPLVSSLRAQDAAVKGKKGKEEEKACVF